MRERERKWEGKGERERRKERGRETEWGWEKDRQKSSIWCFILPTATMATAESGLSWKLGASARFCLSLPHGCISPTLWVILCCLPGALSGRWFGSGTGWIQTGSYMECQCQRWYPQHQTQICSILSLIFWETAQLFSTAVLPFYTPTSSTQRFHSPFFTNTCYFLFLFGFVFNTLSYQYEVVSHCTFGLPVCDGW